MDNFKNIINISIYAYYKEDNNFRKGKNMGKTINYFGGNCTAKGFVDFYNSIFEDVKESYIFKGGYSVYKSKLLKNLQEKYEISYNVDVIHSGIDQNELEAIIVKDLDIAFINGDLIHGNDIIPKNSRIIEVDLADSIDIDKFLGDKCKIDTLKDELYKNIDLAAKKFAEGLNVHDSLESYYIKSMNFNKANKLTEELGEKLIPINKNIEGKTSQRYFGAATPIGAVDYINNISDGLKKYFIKGRAGTGKSTLLKKLVKKGEEKGYEVEVYHCAFDPNSLDMVVIREIGFAIFDSTAPHEYFPDKEDDEVFDAYQEFCEDDVDNLFKDSLEKIENDYITKKAEGIKYIKKVKEIKNEIDEIYKNIFDEAKANQIIAKVISI